MRPLLIGIGGAGSGSGKTTAACEILRALATGDSGNRGARGTWAAIKCTPTELYTAVVSDPVVLAEEGKDTARYLQAGAAGVIWVQATHEEMAEALRTAIGMLAGHEGIIVEGNSAIELLRPDIVIFTTSTPGIVKDGAEAVLGMADLVVDDPLIGAGVSADAGSDVGRGQPGCRSQGPVAPAGWVGRVMGMVDGRKAERGSAQ